MRKSSKKNSSIPVKQLITVLLALSAIEIVVLLSSHMSFAGQGIWLELTLAAVASIAIYLLVLRPVLRRFNKHRESLQASEARLLETQAVAHLGTWELDAITDTVEWSPEMYRIFGKKPGEDEISETNFLSMVHPDDRKEFNRVYFEARDSGEDYIVEYRIPMPDGEIKHVRERGKFYLDKNGQAERALGTIIDITELKQATDKLVHATTVLQQTGEGVMVADTRGNLVSVNPAFEHITGYRAEEVIGHNPRFLQSGRHEHRFYRKMWRSILKYGFWRGEVWSRRKNGELFAELLRINAIKDDEGNTTGYVGISSDITERKNSEERLNFLAYHDTLTGLPNRVLLNERLEQSILRARRRQEKLAVIFIDLDHFKTVNDSLGHLAGDELLVQMGERLPQPLRAFDMVARISGDEFAVVMEDIGHVDNVINVVEKLMVVFEIPFWVASTQVNITASLGISIYPHDGTTAEELLRNADSAMYQSKDLGRSTYNFYTSELTEKATEHLFLDNALRGALERSEFALVFQPQVKLSTAKIVGLEVLLRWHHDELGPVSPAKFIPIAETSGQIREIGAWVLEASCRQAVRWLDKGLKFGRIAVNVSGVQFRAGDFVSIVKSILDKTGMPPQLLELEVTESFIMEHKSSAVGQLMQLQAMGIEIAIDDFGTGYSSLSYLKRLPVNMLKIDKSFIDEVPDNANDVAITEAVIAMAKAIGLGSLAEGIETEEQNQALMAKGCQFGQGYLFSRPLPAEEVEKLLSEETSYLVSSATLEARDPGKLN